MTSRRTPIFLIYNLIVWPSGLLLPLLTSGLFWYPITYSNTYIAGDTCRGEFEFELNDDSTECLLVGNSKIIWLMYYVGIVAILVAAIFMFFLALSRASKLCKKPKKSNIGINSSSELFDEYHESIGCNHSQIVWKTTLRLSTAAFVYILSVATSVAFRVYEIYYGPIKHQKLRGVSNLWLQLAGYLIGASNIIFYGYFSPLFRLETLRVKDFVLIHVMNILSSAIGQKNWRKNPSEYDVIFDLDPMTSSDTGYRSGATKSWTLR